MAEIKKRDVAKTTIFMLLVLTIVISAVSTWVILDTISNLQQQYISTPSAQQKGYVGITVLPKLPETRVTGGVTFEVIPTPAL